MKFIEISIIIIFAFSLFANICYGLFNERFSKYTFRWDYFRWISSYRLFSVTPRYYKLYYRDKLETEQLTDWEEIPLIIQRRWYHPLLFFENLVPDVIDSFIDDLVRLRESGMEIEKISTSFHFQTVLHYVKRFPFSEKTIARQFKIEESSGYISSKKDEQLLISSFHNK